MKTIFVFFFIYANFREGILTTSIKSKNVLIKTLSRRVNAHGRENSKCFSQEFAIAHGDMNTEELIIFQDVIASFAKNIGSSKVETKVKVKEQNVIKIIEPSTRSKDKHRLPRNTYIVQVVYTIHFSSSSSSNNPPLDVSQYPHLFQRYFSSPANLKSLEVTLEKDGIPVLRDTASPVTTYMATETCQNSSSLEAAPPTVDLSMGTRPPVPSPFSPTSMNDLRSYGGYDSISKVTSGGSRCVYSFIFELTAVIVTMLAGLFWFC